MSIIERQKKLQRTLEKLDLDAFFTTNASTVRYFTDVIANRYPERSVYLLASKENIFVLTYPLEIESVKNEAKGCEIIELKTGSKLEDIIEINVKKEAKIGIESNSLPTMLAKRLESKFQLSDIFKEIALIRAKKDESEIEKIKKAIVKTEKTLMELKGLIETKNLTEKEAALETMKLLLKNGCEWFAFEPIIASGKNGAYPHAIPSDNIIVENSFIIVDIGGKDEAGGYCADITRTFVKGRIGEEEKKVFETVKEALEEAISGIREGVKGKEVDSIARNVLAKSGIDKYFNHGLGHGLGLDVHEYPSLSSLSEDTLEENYVVTVEPGVYFPNKYGIRLEQDVLVKKNKAELLTTFPLDYS
ncbi:MAG TPA: aminopeptidase P family protein [Geobacterales bacterium]|nr:aminopeptidase P family protein [Geobacterales bacterium]